MLELDQALNMQIAALRIDVAVERDARGLQYRDAAQARIGVGRQHAPGRPLQGFAERLHARHQIDRDHDDGGGGEVIGDAALHNAAGTE